MPIVINPKGFTEGAEINAAVAYSNPAIRKSFLPNKKATAFSALLNYNYTPIDSPISGAS
jgi:hypothetical protein